MAFVKTQVFLYLPQVLQLQFCGQNRKNNLIGCFRLNCEEFEDLLIMR